MIKPTLLLAIYAAFFSTTYAKAVEETAEKTVQQAQPAEQSSEDANDKALAAAMIMMLSQNEEFQQEFKKMQQDLPKFLSISKQYRQCLQAADRKPEAVNCQKTAKAKADEMNLKDSDADKTLGQDLGDWSAAEKQQYLQQLDENLQKAEKAKPCLLKAKSPVEIINCPGFGEG